MKIGESLATQGPEVQLPIEIITQIVSYLPSGSLGQRSAWACCLVSRQWYSAAISKLYERPRLTGPNFDKFAAVICPPINAHIHRTGLEHHVKHLDMSGVAYESSNSQTARLLRRVGPTLEAFIAPATSFSTIGLAPLAKCQRLRRLDLHLTRTHSFSHIDMYALLSCIGKLMSLLRLSLPPSNFAETRLGDPRNANVEWPPNLAELQFNQTFPASKAWWAEIACHWPSTLNSLIFRDCKYTGLLSLTGLRYKAFPQITSLRVDAVEAGREMEIGLDSWVEAFPQLRFLSVPGKGMELTVLSHLEPGGRLIPRIEQLELTPDAGEVENFSTYRTISRYAATFPSLWQIRVHELYLEFDDVWADCQDANTLLKNRVIEQNNVAGRVVHDPEEAGVSFI